MEKRIQLRPRTVTCVLLLACGALLLAGCGGDRAAPTNFPATSTPLATASPIPQAGPTDTPIPQGEGIPAGTLATSGEAVFAAECAECHGEQGEGLIGPPLLGKGANLTAFKTAGGLYDFVRLSMPQDAPGSLTDEQYLEVISYMLLQNALVEPDVAIDIDALSGIPLE